MPTTNNAHRGEAGNGLSGLELAVMSICLSQGPLKVSDLRKRRLSDIEAQTVLQNLLSRDLMVEVELPSGASEHHLSELGIFYLFDLAKLAEDL